MTSPLQDLESFGGGVCLTRRGIESRVTEATLWSAFEKPLVVWVHGPSFDDSCMARLIEIAHRFPHIRRFRFTSTCVHRRLSRNFMTFGQIFRLREWWSNKRGAGNGGLDLLFHAGRPRPAVPDRER